jgi:hypothetical protein
LIVKMWRTPRLLTLDKVRYNSYLV